MNCLWLRLLPPKTRSFVAILMGITVTAVKNGTFFLYTAVSERKKKHRHVCIPGIALIQRDGYNYCFSTNNWKFKKTKTNLILCLYIHLKY